MKTKETNPAQPTEQVHTRDDVLRALDEARRIHLIQPDKAREICERTIRDLSADPATLNFFRQELSSFYLVQGESHQQTCDHQGALEAFIQSLEMIKREGDQPQIGDRLTRIAHSHAHLMNFPEALSIIYRALDMAQQGSDKLLEGKALNTIGLIYLQLTEPLKALSFIQQAFDILEQNGKPDSVSLTYHNFSRAYLNLGQYEKALQYGQKAVEHHRLTGDYHLMASNLTGIGQVYQAQQDQKKAQEAYNKALEIARKFGYHCEASMALCRIGEIRVDQKDYQAAQDSLEESLTLIHDVVQHPVYAECHRLLAELYTQQNNYEKALRSHRTYHAAIYQRYQQDLASRVRVLEMANNLETANKISEALQAQNEELRAEVKLRKEAQAKLEELSQQDALTGIYNRRYFFELADREFIRARRYGHPLSAIMIDLDYFKSINDQHGHIVGDQVLIEVARRIRHSARQVDLVGRYGGEEFVVLLPETSLADAEVLAMRIWQNLTEEPTITRELSIPVKASIGISCCTKADSIGLDELIDRADKALYRAKDLGRNRIISYTPELRL